MSDAQRIAAHNGGIATLAPAEARLSDDADLTRRRGEYGAAILAHHTFYRAAFPNSSGPDTLDKICGEIATAAVRLMDKGAVRPRPFNSVKVALYLAAADSLGIPREASERVPYGRVMTIADGTLAIDKTTGSASILAAYVEFFRLAIANNGRGDKQWTIV